MVDFAMDVHKSLYPDQEVPATLKDKRSQVVENFKKLQAETEPVLKIFADKEVTGQIQQSRDSKQLLDFLIKANRGFIRMHIHTFSRILTTLLFTFLDGFWRTQKTSIGPISESFGERRHRSEYTNCLWNWKKCLKRACTTTSRLLSMKLRFEVNALFGNQF